MALRKSFGEVIEFVFPEQALEYIKTEFVNKLQENKTAIFLDINMPALTGWEFLEEFERFPEPVKNLFNIYMLSSSADPTDILRAILNPYIIDFIEKPLNKAVLSKMFG